MWPFKPHVCGETNHRYESRYDVKLPPDQPLPRVSLKGEGSDTLADIVEAWKDRIYVHDVCVRCGRKVTRGA